MRINLLLSGNELMNGDIVDSNSAMIARRLTPHGWAIRRKLTVGDDLPLLVSALRELASDSAVLLVNGGLGPTVDDLTAAALAQACDVPLAEHPQALAHLEQWCAQRGIALNAANHKQALLPEGATIVANPIGSAVGFSLQLQDCLVVCTPGVPRELAAMLDEAIISELAKRFPAGSALVHRFSLFGAGESGLQQKIADQIPDWPAAVELGFRAAMPTLELKLSCQNTQGRKALEQILARLRPMLADILIGEGDITVAERTVALLAERRLRITCAESCTGGAIAALLTQVPGASHVFDAGFVTYSDAIKHAVLGVDSDDLSLYGAVSESVVRQMAAGALRISGADLAVAVSGVAGPGGGSSDKPVGTVWLAWGGADDIRACRLHLPMERPAFQQYVSTIALDLIRRRLQGIQTEPSYLRRKK